MRSRNMGFLLTSCGQPIPRRRNTFQLQPKRKTDKRALLPYAWLVDVPVPVPVPGTRQGVTYCRLVREYCGIEVDVDKLENACTLYWHYSTGWENLGWFNVYVRIGLLLWSGSRLFGFIGAGATLGQLFGGHCSPSVGPTWAAVVVSETLRKVNLVSRPGRELYLLLSHTVKEDPKASAVPLLTEGDDLTDDAKRTPGLEVVCIVREFQGREEVVAAAEGGGRRSEVREGEEG
ncbi:unnamed protein product [Prunus armeniaca]